MSADLLVRLRRAAMTPDSLLAQAADEIERLRAASAAPAKTPLYVEDLLDLLDRDKGRSVSVLAGYMGTCELAINAENLCVQLRKRLVKP